MMAPSLQLSVFAAVSLAAALVGAQDLDQPQPYSFSYGVSDTDPEGARDVKAHQEERNAAGRTEGEYRWLMPDTNRYMVVRYYVDGESGFVAEVTEEEASAPVENHSRSSVAGGDLLSAAAATPLARTFEDSNRGFERSLGAAVNVIRAPRPSSRRPTAAAPVAPVAPAIPALQAFSRPFTSRRPVAPVATPFPSVPLRPVVGRTSAQRAQVLDIDFDSGEFIRGGVIDGGIIDGGIIDGGIIDGGFIRR